MDLIDPRPDEVLVRTVCSGVCHSDLHFVDGMGNLQMPMVLGHEASGVVEQVGEDVSYVKPGDHVIMSFKPVLRQLLLLPARASRTCATTRRSVASAARITWKGKPVLQIGERRLVRRVHDHDRSGVVKIPNEMPMAEAALVGCGVMTGVGAALYTAKVPGGAITAVIGCGGIGLNMIQGCQLAGASRDHRDRRGAREARDGASASAPRTRSTPRTTTRSRP